MAIREAVQIGNKIIRTRAKKVTSCTSVATQTVVRDLIDSMRHYELVGMAAPQIGDGVRIFVSEIRKTKLRKTAADGLDGLRVYINPVIVSVSKKQEVGWEGCGSVANSNLFGKVRRPVSVVVEALDEKGNRFRLAAKGLLARVIQHEYDHLEGVVFVDKSDPKTYMSKNEYVKMQEKRTK